MGEARRRLLGVSECRFQLRRSGFQTMDHGVGLVPRPICLGPGYAKPGGDRARFVALAETRPGSRAMPGGTMAGSVSSASHAAASVSASRVMGHKSWDGSGGGGRGAVRRAAPFGVARGLEWRAVRRTTSFGGPHRSEDHTVRRATPFGGPHRSEGHPGMRWQTRDCADRLAVRGPLSLSIKAGRHRWVVLGTAGDVGALHQGRPGDAARGAQGRRGVNRGQDGAGAAHPTQADRAAAAVAHQETRNLTVPALGSAADGNLALSCSPAAKEAFNTEAEREPRRTTERACLPISRGRLALSVALRGSRSASVLKALLNSVPAQAQPDSTVCVRRRESERRGRRRSGPVRELCLDAWVTLRAGRWPPPRPGHMVLVTDRMVRLSPRR